MSSKAFDIFVLILLFLASSIYTYLTRDLFIGKALFPAVIYIIPSVLYLGLRSKKYWKKIFVSALIFGGLFGFIFEFFQEFNKSYNVVSYILPKVFGVVPLDNVLGHVLMALLTLVFYEHFIDRKKSSHVSKHILFALIPSLIVIVLTLFLFIVKPDLLILRYPYFYMGLAAIIPPILLGLTKPAFIKDMATVAIYFFFLYFIVEIVAVKLNWWIYPGNNYIGQVTVAGVTYPFEELFFWMMFYAASLVSYYELFIDENKFNLLDD